MLDRDEPEPPFDEPDPGQVLGERVQGAEPVVVRRLVPVLIGVADEVVDLPFERLARTHARAS
jgi:hypothetical protein